MKKNKFLLKMLFVLILTVATVIGIGTISASAATEPDASSEPVIKYANLSFENEVHLMYAVKTESENVKLLVWREVQSEYLYGTQSSTVSPLSEKKEIDGVLYTVFKYKGLSAKQMTDDVYARAYDTVSGEYSKPVKYSVLQYAYSKLGKTGTASTNQKLTTMLTTMLQYGAATQEYLDYKTDSLATDDFAQIKLKNGTLPDGFNCGLYKVGSSVTITAPETNESGIPFEKWVDKLGATVSTELTATLTVGESNAEYTALYSHIHNEVVSPEVAPTCTETGLTEGSYCSLCGEVFIEQETVPATGHINIQKIEATDAKCTESGNIEYYHCSDCNTNLTGTTIDADIIPEGEELTSPKGHSRATIVNAVPSTHYQWGNYEYYVCPECDGRKFASRDADADEFINGSEKIAPMGHQRAEKISAVAPTCTTAGNIEYWYCVFCNKNFTDRTPESEILTEEDVIIPALGHCEIELCEMKIPTHTEDGYTEYWHCLTCDAMLADNAPDAETLTAEDITLFATGHIRATKVDAKAPTDTTPGNIEYYHCEECNKNFTGRAPDAEEIPEGEEVIPALGDT